MSVVIFASVVRVFELSDGGSVDMLDFFFDLRVVGIVFCLFIVIIVCLLCWTVAAVAVKLQFVVSGPVVVCVCWDVGMFLDVAGPVVPSVVQLSAMASEDVGACTDHVWSEGELLAVEDEHVTVVVEVVLAPSTLFLESLYSVELLGDFILVLVDFTIVLVDFAVVVVAVVVVLADAVVQLVDVHVEHDEGFPECLESNHKLGFRVQPFLILALVSDGVPWVEIIDLLPVVSIRNVSVIVVIVLIDGIGRLVGKLSCISGGSEGGGERKFHSVIFVFIVSDPIRAFISPF